VLEVSIKLVQDLIENLDKLNFPGGEAGFRAYCQANPQKQAIRPSLVPVSFFSALECEGMLDTMLTCRPLPFTEIGSGGGGGLGSSRRQTSTLRVSANNTPSGKYGSVVIPPSPTGPATNPLPPTTSSPLPANPMMVPNPAPTTMPIPVAHSTAPSLVMPVPLAGSPVAKSSFNLSIDGDVNIYHKQEIPLPHPVTAPLELPESYLRNAEIDPSPPLETAGGSGRDLMGMMQNLPAMPMSSSSTNGFYGFQ